MFVLLPSQVVNMMEGVVVMVGLVLTVFLSFFLKSSLGGWNHLQYLSNFVRAGRPANRRGAARGFRHAVRRAIAHGIRHVDEGCFRRGVL